MKKVKLKLKFDELDAIYADLFNNVKVSHTMRVNRIYEHTLLYSTLTELYTKLAPKMMFRTDKRITITMSIPQACALFMYIHNSKRNAALYLDNVYIKIANHIDQQLA